MDEEMAEEDMVNLIGGDYDPKKKMAWDSFVTDRIKKMKNNEPQLRAFNTILRSTRQKNPKQRLFFVEGSHKQV